MVSEPGQYRWSSYRTNALGLPNDLVVPHSEWLELGPNDQVRRKAYRELFNEFMGQDEARVIRMALRKGLPVGRAAVNKRGSGSLK
jgi:putative transposase